MKRKVLIFLLAVCILILSGCSRLEKVDEPAKTVISNLTAPAKEKITEFTAVDIPRGCTVLNADMYDEKTVILMLSGSSAGEYKVAFYNTDSGLSTVYSGMFDAEYGEYAGFYPVTLSVKPYVVADLEQQMIYKFNDDFTDVSKFSTYTLDTYAYEYSVSRNSLIYTISNEASCELREYFFASGDDVLVAELSSFYSYADLSKYYDASGLVVLDGSELFTDNYVGIMIDINTGEIIGQFGSEYTMHNATDGKACMSWFVDTANDLYITTIDPRLNSVGAVYCVDMTDSVFSMNTDEYMYVINSDTGDKCYISGYDIAEGVLMYESECDYRSFLNLQLPVGNNEPVSVFLSSSERFGKAGDTVLFRISTEGYYSNSLFLWNTELAEEKNTQLAAEEAIDYPVYTIKKNVYVDSNTEYAEMIEAEYGVNIFYGDSADMEFQDYNVEMVYDETEIYNGLMLLEEVLAMYPDGFFDEFSESGYLRGINIYLCGDMTPIGVETITDPAAFTYTNSGYAMIVANLNEGSSLVSHFCHEISHVIDNRLISEGFLDEIIWNSFNPEGFEYKNSYKDDAGNDYTDNASDEYTVYDNDYYLNGDTERIFFIDSYSKTYPTEDRARVMEYAMASGYTSEYFVSSHLQAKLKYLSECVRSCWDSTFWNSDTQWEQYLID